MAETIRKVVIGTRGSDLALAQTELVAGALGAARRRAAIELRPIVTTGDRHQTAQGPIVRDKVDWIKEIESEVLSGAVDFAVHSGKDIPREVDTATSLLPVLKRANPFDVVVYKEQPSTGDILESFPRGACIGTASVRRKAQLLAQRPDLEVIDHRGNVPTRLRKLQESDRLYAVVLAAAGLERLDLHGLPVIVCDHQKLLPAVNQGILVAQFRSDDSAARELLQQIVDPEVQAVWLAEREVVRRLEADCGSAVSVYGEIAGGRLRLRAMVFATDGSRYLEAQQEGGSADAGLLGDAVGRELLAHGASELL